MSLTVVLCLAVSLVATEFAMRRRGTPYTFVKLLVVGLVVSVLLTAFAAPGKRSGSRSRPSVETRVGHRASARAERRAARLSDRPAPAAATPRELPVPPRPPTPASSAWSIEVDAPSDSGNDAANDAELTDDLDVLTVDPAELERTHDEPPVYEHPSHGPHDGWDGASERFTDFLDTVVDRSTAIAERVATRADGFRDRVEQFRAEHIDDDADDDDEATQDDDAAQAAEDADSDPGHRSLPRRGPGTLVTILASTALLYVGYLFLDANTRGQFTWSLRVASLFAFAGIIAAVVSLT